MSQTSPETETDSDVAGLIERLENWNHGCKTMIVSETIDTLRRLSQKVANYRGLAQRPNAVLEQIAIVCTDNMDRDCDHRMALDFVRQIANDALSHSSTLLKSEG